VIAVSRCAKPLALCRKATSWLRDLQTATTAAERKRAEKRYNCSGVRTALEKMFHGKCAYCESAIVHVGYPHIEHFRPKVHYPELTFEWENLLLACSVCNSSRHKGDKFPIRAGVPLLINPCVDDPSDHFEFTYDRTARVASVYGKTERGRTAETMLGLNRAELRDHRSLHVRRLVVLAQTAASDPQAGDLLDEACFSSSEYAAFARAVKQRYASSRLPMNLNEDGEAVSGGEVIG